MISLGQNGDTGALENGLMRGGLSRALLVVSSSLSGWFLGSGLRGYAFHTAQVTF